MVARGIFSSKFPQHNTLTTIFNLTPTEQAKISTQLTVPGKTTISKKQENLGQTPIVADDAMNPLKMIVTFTTQ